MITPAQHRALVAVRDGHVVRIYRGNGNVLKGPAGVASSTLWTLDRKGWIADGASDRHSRGVFSIPAKIILTAAGKKALNGREY